MKIVAEGLVPPRHLGLLGHQVCVVQLFDLLGDGQDRFAPRHHLAPQEPGAAENLLRQRPVEERIEGLPVVIELRLQVGNPLVVSPGERLELRNRRHVRPPEFRQSLPVLRAALALDIQEVVAHENAGEMHVRTEAAKLDVNVVVVGVELVELGVDLLCLARRREHGDHDQHQQTTEPERRHGPRLEPHQDLRRHQRRFPKVTSHRRPAGIRQTGETPGTGCRHARQNAPTSPL
jgi:hypothetical protein